jgi:YbbR domain-containing protein
MIRRLLDNIEIKIICLFLAVIMWLYANDRTDILNRVRDVISGAEQGRITLRDVPIDLIGSKDASKFSTEPNQISISVIFTSNAVIDISSLRAKVKLTQKDNKQVLLNEDNVILPEGLRFIEADPKEIKIHTKSGSG